MHQIAREPPASHGYPIQHSTRVVNIEVVPNMPKYTALSYMPVVQNCLVLGGQRIHGRNEKAWPPSNQDPRPALQFVFRLLGFPRDRSGGAWRRFASYRAKRTDPCLMGMSRGYEIIDCIRASALPRVVGGKLGLGNTKSFFILGRHLWPCWASS